MQTMGERIRIARKSRGMTQKALAYELGYEARSSVNRLEQQETISEEKAKQIADILNCSYKYILGTDTSLEKKRVTKATFTGKTHKKEFHSRAMIDASQPQLCFEFATPTPEVRFVIQISDILKCLAIAEKKKEIPSLSDNFWRDSLLLYNLNSESGEDTIL